MKHKTAKLITTVCAIVLFATSCTLVDFNNPLDPKGNDYLNGDKTCEAEKIRDYEDGAGFFTKPELMRGCEDGEN